MSIIVISQPWGGLGDNLQFSTLPKLYSEMGYDVYISTANVYRNPEIYDLVWKLNPYVKGVSDEPPNVGACQRFHLFTDQFIKNIELSHGLVHGTEIYPSIYYKPTKIESLCDTLIYDMTSISSSYSDDFIQSSFSKVFDMYPTTAKKRIIFRNINNRMTPDFQTECMIVDNIFQYCDIIYSCKAYVSLLSGGSVLASAIKQHAATPDIHCIHTKYSNIFTFSNATYYFGSSA
jgi:hypothetical protein